MIQTERRSAFYPILAATRGRVSEAPPLAVSQALVFATSRVLC